MSFDPLEVAYFGYSNNKDQKTMKDSCTTIRNITYKAETSFPFLEHGIYLKMEELLQNEKWLAEVWNSVWCLRMFFWKVGNHLVNRDATLVTMDEEMVL